MKKSTQAAKATAEDGRGSPVWPTAFALYEVYCDDEHLVSSIFLQKAENSRTSSERGPPQVIRKTWYDGDVNFHSYGAGMNVLHMCDPRVTRRLWPPFCCRVLRRRVQRRLWRTPWCDVDVIGLRYSTFVMDLWEGPAPPTMFQGVLGSS